MLFCFFLQLLQLGYDLTCLLQRMLIVFFPFSKEQESCDVRKQLSNKGIVDEVKQLGLDLRLEDNRIELCYIPDFLLVSHCHLMLFASNVHLISMDSAVRLKRFYLGKNGIEPLFKVKVALGLKDERT